MTALMAPPSDEGIPYEKSAKNKKYNQEAAAPIKFFTELMSFHFCFILIQSKNERVAGKPKNIWFEAVLFKITIFF